jgi:glycosyltransferase involved in cell wall biosynthesis
MPGYAWAPSGGFKVAYEYANHLAGRGHDVTLVHPRQLEDAPQLMNPSLYQRFRKGIFGLRDLVSTPKLDWQRIDEKVRLLFVPNADDRFIPPGDAVFATACFTVDAVRNYPASRGQKFYLIQGYETWMKPKEYVDATWRAPLHKAVVSNWLFDLGKTLGVSDVVYIPNAIDHDKYRCTRPIHGRALQIAMLFSAVPIKGANDGIAALEIVRKRFPTLKAVFFGAGRRQSWIPDWIEYYRNPRQEFIVNEIYNKSRIVLSPSWSEGFALPPAEAAACGCAIVATDSGGIRDFVENGVTGLLSPPRDSAALAEHLSRLLENESLAAKLSAACQDRLKDFTWERSTALLEEFIRASLRN